MAAIYRLLPGRCGRVRVGDHGRGIGDLALAQLHGTMLFYPSGILFLLLSLWDELEVHGKLFYCWVFLLAIYGITTCLDAPSRSQFKKKNPSRSEIYLTGSGGTVCTD